MQESTLLELARLPFDGNAVAGMVRGAGPRRAYIVDAMREAGLEPYVDEYGNVWMERGNAGEYRLVSSHMDVDATKGQNELVLDREGPNYRGILDNAVGCYLNMLAAAQHRAGQRTFYVFTASEEEEVGNPTNKFRSAKDVVKVLSRKGVRPELCAALDITYPRLNTDYRRTWETPDEIDDVWLNVPAEELFDFGDKTQCYVDGLASADAKRIAQRLVDTYGNPRITTRDMVGWDESKIYGEIAPAFAVGPVAFGKFDEPNQVMPVENGAATLEFLKFMAECRI